MLYVDYQNNDKKVARVHYNMILMMDELRKYAFTFDELQNNFQHVVAALNQQGILAANSKLDILISGQQELERRLIDAERRLADSFSRSQKELKDAIGRMGGASTVIDNDEALLRLRVYEQDTPATRGGWENIRPSKSTDKAFKGSEQHSELNYLKIVRSRKKPRTSTSSWPPSTGISSDRFKPSSMQ